MKNILLILIIHSLAISCEDTNAILDIEACMDEKIASYEDDGTEYWKYKKIVHNLHVTDLVIILIRI